MFLTRFSWKMHFIFLVVLIHFVIYQHVKERRAKEHWQPFVKTPLSLSLPKVAKCFSTEFSKFVTLSNHVHTYKHTQRKDHVWSCFPAPVPIPAQTLIQILPFSSSAICISHGVHDCFLSNSCFSTPLFSFSSPRSACSYNLTIPFCSISSDSLELCFCCKE